MKPVLTENLPAPGADSWFCALDPVHQIPGRVRFRYRLAPGLRLEVRLVRAIQALPGVIALRFNAKARALAVNVDSSVVSVRALREGILAIVPAQTPAAGTGATDLMAPGANNLAPSALASFLSIQRLPETLKLPVSLAVAMPVF